MRCVVISTVATEVVAVVFINDLLIYTTGQESAVDGEYLARNKTRRVGSQEDRSAGELLDIAEATHRSAQLELAPAFRFIQQLLVECGAENSGGDRIDANAVTGPLDRERLCERANRGLAGRVGGDFVQCDESRKRGDVDDAARLAFEHMFAEDLAGAQSPGEVCVDDGVPLVFRKRDRRRAFGPTSGVDEDVDLAKRRH